MANIADSLGLDVEQVKRANLYQQGDISPTVSKIKYITNQLCMFQKAHKHTSSCIMYCKLLYSDIFACMVNIRQVDPQKGGMPLKYCNIQQLWDG